MSDLKLKCPQMRYDMMLPLLEGRVAIDGVELRPEPMTSMIFNQDSDLRTGDFGLYDLNLGFLLPAIEAGWEVVGLPVFSKRKPVYEYIFCRADAGIESPRDLEGKRIFSGRYASSINIWLRGLLRHRHGVDTSKLCCVVTSHGVFPPENPESTIELAADPKKSGIDSLLDGEVDAIMSDISDVKLFEQLESHPDIRRLFPDYEDEDYRLYQETGIFTPVHMMVMSRKVDREHPDLARRLYAAFEESKETATRDILSDQRGFGVAYLRERKKEEIERWGDPWRHGIAANRTTIDTFAQYNLEQGINTSALPYESIFAAGTLDT